MYVYGFPFLIIELLSDHAGDSFGHLLRDARTRREMIFREFLLSSMYARVCYFLFVLVLAQLKYNSFFILEFTLILF